MRRKRLRDPPASPMISQQQHGYLFKSLSIDCKSDQDSSPKSCDGSDASLGSFSQRSSDVSERRDSVCYGCRLSLASSPLIACVSGYHKWHIECLRCSECDDLLGQERTCFIKNGRIYCREDYGKLIRDSVKCAKCFRLISPSDWVRKAASSVYHLACFACDLCQRQLSTGEQFTIDTQSSNESKLLCKLHFGINKEGDCHDSSSNDSTASSSLKPSKTKRVRTTFTEEQLQVLQANFQIDSNPDGQDLERIASLTGLSKRVTQVWFQNSRARQKKYMNKTRGGLHSSGGTTSGWTSAGSDITTNAWSVGGAATDQGSHCSDDGLSSPV